MYQLTADDKMKLNRIIRWTAILFFMGVAFFIGKFLAQAPLEALEETLFETKTLQSQIKSSQKEYDELSRIIENNGKELVNLTTDKNEYINAAGNLSELYDVKLSKFAVSDVDMKEGSSIGTMHTTIELEGSLFDIKRFVAEFCKSENTNTVYAISLRASNEFVWLHRTIDNNAILPWFDTTSLEETTVLLEDTLKEAPSPIGVNDIFRESPMKCYLEINFIGLC